MISARRLIEGGLTLALLCMNSAWGHALILASITLVEHESGLVSLAWQVPSGASGGAPSLGFRLQGCTPLTKLISSWVQETYRASQDWHCPQKLGGSTLIAHGPASAAAQIAISAHYASGRELTSLLNPTDHGFHLPLEPHGWKVWQAYAILGIHHIMGGTDHLLFVAGLILLVTGWRRLLWTVSGFTAGHSLTLTLASLSRFAPPAPPTEAAIALSILYLAFELTDAKKEPLKKPWRLAGAFGLLHGFGFAGALAEAGLPYKDRLSALVAFNLGVEIGQIAFIAMVLLLAWVCKAAFPPQWHKFVPWRALASYGMGMLATFWLFERSSWLWS